MTWKETKRYWKRREAAVFDRAHRAPCRTFFGRRYGPAVKTGYVTIVQIYWYEPNQSRYRCHHAESCTMYVFRVFDKIFTLSQIFSRRVLYFLCHFFFLWRMVSEESYESRYQVTKMRATVFLLIFCEQVRGPQSWSTEFAVSYDPDSEQVGESKPWTLTDKADSGMGTHKNYVREVQWQICQTIPPRTRTPGRAASGGSFPSHAIKQSKPQPTNDIIQRSYLGTTGQIPATSQTVRALIHRGTPHTAWKLRASYSATDYSLFHVLYPAPAREHVPYITLRATQAFPRSKYTPTWQKICRIVYNQESLLSSEYNESVPRPDPLKTTLSNIFLARYILILSSNLSTNCRWTSKSPWAKTYLIARKCKQNMDIKLILFWVVGIVYELCCRRFGGTCPQYLGSQ